VIQQLYEGTRFWGTFVLFDVPPYEADSNKTKYTFLYENREILEKTQQRRLLPQSRKPLFPPLSFIPFPTQSKIIPQHLLLMTNQTKKTIPVPIKQQLIKDGPEEISKT
jgi:hypothetical protein